MTWPRLTFEQAFWKYVPPITRMDECWPWTGYKVHGYGMIDIAQRKCGAHRAAWEFANGPILNGLHVLHHCDNPPCVNPNHLWLGTHVENMADMRSKGRSQRHGRAGRQGVLHHSAKLTEDQVREIRQITNMSVHKIAKIYGVTRGAIYHIQKGKNWRHLL